KRGYSDPGNRSSRDRSQRTSYTPQIGACLRWNRQGLRRHRAARQSYRAYKEDLGQEGLRRKSDPDKFLKICIKSGSMTIFALSGTLGRPELCGEGMPPVAQSSFRIILGQITARLRSYKI